MAMKPFCGYHFGDYFAHWLSFDVPGAKLPKIFHVNWFRKDADGNFLWPGFGENLRVLEWIVGRVTGDAGARAQAPGLMPEASDIAKGDDAAVSRALRVDDAEWSRELAEQQAFWDLAQRRVG